jgi:MATE efflux family protein
LAIAIWIGVGVSVLVAKYLGKKDEEKANTIVANGIIVSFVVSSTVTFITMNIIRGFIMSFTSDTEIINQAMAYMDICVFMAIPCAVHICIQKVLQGTGNMLAPMCFQIAGVVVNLIFDPVLIFGYLGFKPMGVRGAAIATVMGYTFSTILAFLVLIFQKQKVKLGLKYFIIRFNHVRDIFVVGFPSFIMNVLGAAMVYNTNLFLKQYSEIAIAFFGAYFKIQQMVIMTLNGLIQGCIPVMSYNYGAKREDRLKESLKIGTIVAIMLTSFSIIMLWTFTKNILLTFNPPKEMFEFGIFGIRIMSLSYVFVGITTMIASYMQSTKNVGKSILINLCRQLLVLIPIMFIGSKTLGLAGIWSAFLATEIICVVLSLVLYKNTKIDIGREVV